MCQDAAGKFMRHLVERGWKEVVGRDERKDGRACVSRPIHVADVDFVQWSFADAKHQRTFLLQANVGGSLDEMRSDSIGDASQGSDTARQHDHSFGGIRAAGNVGADIRVGLLLNFAGSGSEQLLDKVVAAAEVEFFGHHSQGAVGRDEVDSVDALVALDDLQQLAEKNCATGASRSDGQVFGHGVHLLLGAAHVIGLATG